MSSTTSSEVNAAQTAASTDPAINPYAPTFFDKIVSKDIPAKIIYEDDIWFVSKYKFHFSEIKS
jgi:hypothetical protein